MHERHNSFNSKQKCGQSDQHHELAMLRQQAIANQGQAVID